MFKAFPRVLIWVLCSFIIISIYLFVVQNLYRSRLLSEAADTLQALRFPCESGDSAWHQTWETSSGSMKGKRSRLDHPGQIKQPFHVWSTHSLKTNPSMCCLWTSPQLERVHHCSVANKGCRMWESMNTSFYDVIKYITDAFLCCVIWS